MNQGFQPLNIKFESNFIVDCITKEEMLSMIMTISAVDSKISIIKLNYFCASLKSGKKITQLLTCKKSKHVK